MPVTGNLARLQLPRSTDAPTLDVESAAPLLALLEAQGDIIDRMANGVGLRENSESDCDTHRASRAAFIVLNPAHAE